MLGATAFLLSVVFPLLPAAVLQHQAQSLGDVFARVLSRHADDQPDDQPAPRRAAKRSGVSAERMRATLALTSCGS